MNAHVALLAVALASAVPQSTHAADNRLPVTPELRQRAASVIRQVFDQEQEFVKVHAAEYLLALGYPEGVKEVFAKQMDLHGSDPGYRIGIWRVLFRSANDDREQAKWIGRIRDVFLDLTASDRSNAAESLVKLSCKLRNEDMATVERIAQYDNAALVPNAWCILVNSNGHAMGEEFRTDKRLHIELSAACDKPIARLEILKNNQLVWQKKTDAPSATLTADDRPATKTSWYYGRVVLANGHYAWSSPISAQDQR